MPPRGAPLLTFAALRPCFLIQYATVASCRPNRRPISASESPWARRTSSDERSMQPFSSSHRTEKANTCSPQSPIHGRRRGRPGAIPALPAWPLLPLPGVLQHACVGPVEVALDLGAAPGELGHLSALARAAAVDGTVHARELGLQTLDLEQVRGHGFAAALDDELGHQRGKLGIPLGEVALRVGEVPAQMLRGPP